MSFYQNDKREKMIQILKGMLFCSGKNQDTLFQNLLKVLECIATCYITGGSYGNKGRAEPFAATNCSKKEISPRYNFDLR